MNELNIDQAEQEFIRQQILHKEAEILRKRRKKVSAKDFDPIAIIGRGAFGEGRRSLYLKWKFGCVVRRLPGRSWQ
jgi:serine/threonine kinase 38